MPDKAKFRPIQLKDGSAWYVLYSPDKGPTEHLEGFYTEEDAQNHRKCTAVFIQDAQSFSSKVHTHFHESAHSGSGSADAREG